MIRTNSYFRPFFVDAFSLTPVFVDAFFVDVGASSEKSRIMATRDLSDQESVRSLAILIFHMALYHTTTR